MKFFVVLFVPFLLCNGVVCVPYTDCGSIKGKVSGVTVSGCENKSVCPLKKGTTAAIEVNFESETDTKTAKAVVHGIIQGVPLPFPPPQPNACIDSGLKCPLQNGADYNYSTTINVRQSYPSLSVDVKWELRDDNSDDVFCVLIPAKIE